MVEFNVDLDKDFKRTLLDLGPEIARAVYEELFTNAAVMTWSAFVKAYNWMEYVREPIDTYPGAVDYYQFEVPLPQGLRPPTDKVLVFAIVHPIAIVVCAVAQ